jgi:hypothetical protein
LAVAVGVCVLLTAALVVGQRSLIYLPDRDAAPTPSDVVMTTVETTSVGSPRSRAFLS